MHQHEYVHAVSYATCSPVTIHTHHYHCQCVLLITHPFRILHVFPDLVVIIVSQVGVCVHLGMLCSVVTLVLYVIVVLFCISWRLYQ